MYIWKLSPIDLSSPNWEASIYKGDVVVRAESADKARHQATRAFFIATQRKLGEEVKGSPWRSDTESCCELLERSEYSDEGVAEILSPAETTVAQSA